MDYREEILAARNDPRRLEELCQAARRRREMGAFSEGLAACYAQAPDNVLYAAWHYRLQPALAAVQGEARSVNWALAIPLSVVVGLIFYLLATPNLAFPDHMPYLVLLWAPLAGAAIVVFLAAVAGSYWKRALVVVVGLALAAAYVLLLGTAAGRSNYRTLMAIHLPLVAAIGVGLTVLGLPSDERNLFAVLIKSIEVLITGGVFLIVGGMFAGIGYGMFLALGINLSDVLPRLAAAGVGAVAVLAVASVYEPRLRPIEQRFEQGLGKLVPTLTRLLLPLTLLVLVIYLVLIPFRFMEPFRNRDLLIIYNVMLFAVMGLLIGVTPVEEEGLPERYQATLRTGVLAVAGLAAVISLYALSATVYRTVQGGLTINRLTVVGWNVINIGILAAFLYQQLRAGLAGWVRALQAVAYRGIVAYILWTVFLVLATPWLFS